MDRVGAGDLASRQDRGNVEIAVFRSWWPDAHALIRKAHVHGVGVGSGMYGNRGDAEFLAGAQHPQRDLTAIGDQDLIEH